MGVLSAIVGIYRSFSEKIELNKYNDFTIAEYLRKKGARIGDNCCICIRDLGSEPFLIKIGNNVSISSGVGLVTHNIAWGFRNVIPDLQAFGKVEIEDNCSIGAGAVILPGVTVGRNSIIGAGVVVSRSVPADSVVLSGRPTVCKGMVHEYFEFIREKWKQQKPEGYLSDYEKEKSKSQVKLHEYRNRPHNKRLLREHLEKVMWGGAQ